MRSILFFFLIMLAALERTNAGRGAEFVKRTLSVSGVERAYWLRPPRTIPPQGAPVVLMLHGHGGDAENLVGQGRNRAAPYRA